MVNVMYPQVRLQAIEELVMLSSVVLEVLRWVIVAPSGKLSCQ